MKVLFSGLERSQEYLLLLENFWVWSPVPISGGSQRPIPPVPEDKMTSGLQEQLHTHGAQKLTQG